MLLGIDGKILHLKELGFIERWMFEEMLNPEDFYKQFAKFLTENHDLQRKQFFDVAELEKVDTFIKNYFVPIIEESKTWLLRAYVVGRFLAKSDLMGTIFNIGSIAKLPKIVTDAANKYGLSIEEAKALQQAVNEGASLMSNTTASTIQTVRNALFESTKVHGDIKSVLKELKELIVDDIGELNRDWRRVCFPRGTLILTKKGKTPIEKVKVGDEVLTIGSKFERKVIQLHERKYTGYLYIIRTTNGKSITATAEHPIRVRRRNKNLWVPISQITESDEIFGVDGYETYYDKNWLHQKHVVEKLDCKKIAKIVNINPATIRANLKAFGIEIDKTLAFKGRKHTEKTKKKKSEIAKNKNYAERLNTKEARIKSLKTLKKYYAEGSTQIWNKGESKETNLSVQKISHKLEEGFRNGRKTWNFGLTKKTSGVIAESAEKWREYYRLNPKEDREKRAKQSKTLAMLIAKGEFEPFAKSEASHIKNPFTNVVEYINSSYEKIFVEYCISKNIPYKKNHGIIIPYVNSNDETRNYVPDFITDKFIVEIKAAWKIKNNYRSQELKAKAAIKYAKSIRKEFIILTENELEQM